MIGRVGWAAADMPEVGVPGGGPAAEDGMVVVRASAMASKPAAGHRIAERLACLLSRVSAFSFIFFAP
ncbi:hypothetical protein ADL21_02270 [Streptomyces albus subsp. albus]|nr:hypothetical protein ADL21_02270 [Streptomyces albus subsp. albus]